MHDSISPGTSGKFLAMFTTLEVLIFFQDLIISGMPSSDIFFWEPKKSVDFKKVLKNITRKIANQDYLVLYLL